MSTSSLFALEFQVFSIFWSSSSNSPKFPRIPLLPLTQTSFSTLLPDGSISSAKPGLFSPRRLAGLALALPVLSRCAGPREGAFPKSQTDSRHGHSAGGGGDAAGDAALPKGLVLGVHRNFPLFWRVEQSRTHPRHRSPAEPLGGLPRPLAALPASPETGPAAFRVRVSVDPPGVVTLESPGVPGADGRGGSPPLPTASSSGSDPSSSSLCPSTIFLRFLKLHKPRSCVSFSPRGLVVRLLSSSCSRGP